MNIHERIYSETEGLKHMTKILILEDESSIRFPLKEKLIASGYEVYTAVDGEEGLSEVTVSKPDLILLDLYMPKIDGVTFISKLRKNDWGANIPVIVFTNLGSQTIEDQLKAYNISGFFLKANTTLDEILQKIQEII